MNRRQTLKTIGISTLSAGLLLDACKTKTKEGIIETAADKNAGQDRQADEIARDKKLNTERFFTDHEMATITLLGDMIIPRDDHSGSASDAKVPEFIEFIVKDMPDHQIPMRGGLKWLDMQCLSRYNSPFTGCNSSQQLEMVNEIAYPGKARPAMKPGVAFFDRIRSLTATGFFTSKMGIEDLGYVGNRPNKWEGVPADVIKQYGLENVGFNGSI